MESNKDSANQEEPRQGTSIDDLPVEEAGGDQIRGGKHIGNVKYGDG